MQSDITSLQADRPNWVANWQGSAGAIATLTVALLAVSFAPIFVRFSETELEANAMVLNRLLIFFLVFGSARLLADCMDKLSSSFVAL